MSRLRQLPGTLVVVAGAARVAAAEPPGESRQAALREPVIELSAGVARPADLAWSWRLDGMFATRYADDAIDPGAAAVGEAAVAVHGVEWAVVGGLLDVHRGPTLAAEQWATLCLTCDADTRIDVSHHLAWDVEPGLLASARLRAGAERRETVGFKVMQEPAPNEDGSAAAGLGGVEFVVSSAWSPEPATSIDMRALFFRYQRGDLSVDAGDFTGIFLSGQAWLLRAELARVEGISLGGGRRLDVSGGLAGVPELVTIPLAAVRVEQDVGDATLHAGGAQDAFPLPTGEIGVEDRIEVGVAVPAGRVRLRADAFAALTTLVDGAGMTSRVGSGGVTGVAELDLGDHARARVRADLGRGFHGERWGAEVLATLTVHAGTR